MRTIPRATPSIPSTDGFSLIEMIGVLAIIAIVAAIMTPNLARRISRANGERAGVRGEKLPGGPAFSIVSETSDFKFIRGFSSFCVQHGGNRQEHRQRHRAHHENQGDDHHRLQDGEELLHLTWHQLVVVIRDVLQGIAEAAG